MGELPAAVGRGLSRGASEARDAARTLGRLAVDARERGRLAAGLREPGELPRRLKLALVLLAVLLALAAWGVGHAALAAWRPPAVRAWDLAWGLGLLAFATTAFLPGSYVAALLLVRDTSGQAVAVLAAATGAAAGALAVHFIGGALRARLDGAERRGRWFRRLVTWLERATRRFRYAALAVLSGIPLLPDSLPVYLFSLLRLRLAPFLAAVFVGALLRSGLTLAFASQLDGLAWLPRI